MWALVKKIKLETSLEKTCNIDKDDGVPYQGIYSGESDRVAQIEAVEHDLGVKSSELRFENLTANDLTTAAEMFIYLIICPHTNSQKQWFKTWSIFYNDLYISHTTDMIILTRNRILKTMPENHRANIAQFILV